MGNSNDKLVALVRGRGEEYWREELRRARQGTAVYGVVYLLLFVFSFFNVAFHPENIFLPIVAMFAVTIYAGSTQVQLLPFMDSRPYAHWITLCAIGVLSCAGPLWYVMFLHYNRKAAIAIEGAVVASKAVPLSPYPRNSPEL